MPTMGPVTRPQCEAAAVADGVEEEDEVGVDVVPVAVVVRVGRASTGKYCSGLNSIVAFCV